jgi:hypothetical protein
MQLEPGERSILAYFTDQEQARQAGQALKAMGYKDLQIAAVSNYPSRRSYDSHPPYLSNLILGSRENSGWDYNPGHGPLMAADPAVSGMSSPFPVLSQPSCLLTLVIIQEDLEPALEVLQQYGAVI